MPPTDVNWLTPAFPPTYARILCMMPRARGGDPDAALAGSFRSVDRLTRDSSPVTFEIMRRLILAAATLLPAAGLGLTLGQLIPISAHGQVGAAVTASPTLGEALHVLGRYASLRSQPFCYRVIDDSTGMQLRVEERFDLGEIRTTILEAVLVVLDRALTSIVGAVPPGTRYELPFPAPEWAESYPRFLGGESHFGARHLAIRLAAAGLDLPCVSADPIAFASACRDCERALAAIGGDRHAQTLSLIQRRLHETGDDLPTLARLAAEIGMTPRTLIRRLRSAGTSYQALMDQLRRERAVWHLSHTDLTIAEIAERSGLRDTKNFSRAFRRWVGQTPSEFRASSRRLKE